MRKTGTINNGDPPLVFPSRNIEKLGFNFEKIILSRADAITTKIVIGIT